MLYCGLCGRVVAWPDLPPDYGDWSNTHRRFIRCRDKGVWEKLLEILTANTDYEWLMFDGSHCKVHPHATGARGRNQDILGQKEGVQHIATSGRGCAWYVAQGYYYKKYSNYLQKHRQRHSHKGYYRRICTCSDQLCQPIQSLRKLKRNIWVMKRRIKLLNKICHRGFC